MKILSKILYGVALISCFNNNASFGMEKQAPINNINTTETKSTPTVENGKLKLICSDLMEKDEYTYGFSIKNGEKYIKLNNLTNLISKIMQNIIDANEAILAINYLNKNFYLGLPLEKHEREINDYIRLYRDSITLAFRADWMSYVGYHDTYFGDDNHLGKDKLTLYIEELMSDSKRKAISLRILTAKLEIVNNLLLRLNSFINNNIHLEKSRIFNKKCVLTFLNKNYSSKLKSLQDNIKSLTDTKNKVQNLQFEVWEKDKNSNFYYKMQDNGELTNEMEDLKSVIVKIYNNMEQYFNKSIECLKLIKMKSQELEINK